MNPISFTGEEDSSLTALEVCQVRFFVEKLPKFLERLRSIGQDTGCALICFNRDMMAGRRHVETAIRFAERSFRSDNPISRSIEVEALLYAAGTRQTGLIGSFGIQPGMNACYLCILPPSAEAKKMLGEVMKFIEDEDWEEIATTKKEKLEEVFGITPAEIEVTGRERLVDLVLERVALLAINR